YFVNYGSGLVRCVLLPILPVVIGLFIAYLQNPIKSGRSTVILLPFNKIYTTFLTLPAIIPPGKIIENFRILYITLLSHLQ
ncbi:MAG: hypothetical protein ACUVQ4_05220, partial [bacterium]